MLGYRHAPSPGLNETSQVSFLGVLNIRQKAFSQHNFARFRYQRTPFFDHSSSFHSQRQHNTMPGTELQLTEEAWGIFVIIFIAVINLLFGSLAWWIVFEDFRIWIFLFLSVGLWTCIVAAIVGSARALYRSVSLNICYWGFVWMLCLTAHQDWKQ